LKFLVIGLFLTYVTFELLIYIYIKILSKKSKWIILNQDLISKFNKEKFNEFKKKNYNYDLGWDKKPNYKNFDLNGYNKIFYSIDKKGFRSSKFKNLENLVATFGDSYAFCRQVKNTDSWQEISSKKIKKFISNYGVGNFGLDQAFLKFKKTKIHKSTKIVIFGFVPETICRIQSCWKYYLEFGNLHGFKPFLKLKKKKLFFHKNLIKKKINFNHLKVIIKKTEKIDRFYKYKYLKYMFKYSYIYSFFKNFSYNISFFYIYAKYFLKKNSEKNNFQNEIFSLVMKKNIQMSHELYKENYSKTILIQLFQRINNCLKKENKKCYFIIFPQLYDLKIKSRKFYQEFYIKMNTTYNIIDLTDNFLQNDNYKKFYTNDKYGGHLNYKGNVFVSRVICEKLENELLK